MHYYKCPKLNNRVRLMLMNKKLNNYLFMLFPQGLGASEKKK